MLLLICQAVFVTTVTVIKIGVHTDVKVFKMQRGLYSAVLEACEEFMQRELPVGLLVESSIH